jgi:hypothetical protein
MRAMRDAYPSRRRLAEIKLRLEIWLQHHVLRPTLYWRFFELNRALSASYRMRSLDVEIADEITAQALQVSPYQLRQGLRWLHNVAALAVYRRLCCVEYHRAFAGLPGVRLSGVDEQQPLYYFPILVERKQELLRAARSQQIEIIAWPMSTPIYPIEHADSLRQYGYTPGSCPAAEEVAARLVGLPTDTHTHGAHRERIIELVRSFVA